MTWPFGHLQRRHYAVVTLDPPWRFAAGTKSRPQHYDRMTLPQIMALPVRDLLKPEGGRVFLWITAPLLHRLPEIAKAWRLRYSTALPWIKLKPGEGGLFFDRSSFARGLGLEVVGNAEYVAILKAGKPQSIKGKPFPPLCLEPRQQHSRKPEWLHDEIEKRLAGPFAEVFARRSRPNWDCWGNQVGLFDEEAA